LVAVACFLPGRGKDLPAPPRISGLNVLITFVCCTEGNYFLLIA
jgi:hypothetical protein